MGVETLTSKSNKMNEAETNEAETDEAETDEEETDEADVEEGDSLVVKVEAENLIGLEKEGIEASDQPLPTLAKERRLMC